ncbi:MAG: RluA family pseudouridine synthase, partial [Deltaproteobacteria bacterium]
MRILHHDAQVLAVDKPAGVLTVPGRGSGGPALSEEVRAIAPDALPVHRLDRDTSAFESRRAEKTYLALVRGDLSKAQRINASLREPRGGRVRVAGNEQEGRAAQTAVEPKERFGGYTFCACRPRTGRTHQIRVHLALIGHPLACDPRYGDDRDLRVGDLWSGAPDPATVVLARTPLHAAALRIPHPRGRGWLWIESPL